MRPALVFISLFSALSLIGCELSTERHAQVDIVIEDSYGAIEGMYSGIDPAPSFHLDESAEEEIASPKIIHYDFEDSTGVYVGVMRPRGGVCTITIYKNGAVVYSHSETGGFFYVWQYIEI